MTSRLIAQARLETPLGPMTAAATDAGLAGLWFDGQAHHPGVLDAPTNPDQRWLRAAARALDAYFAHRRMPALPFDAEGTPFQQAVWQALRKIPRGQTRSYSQIAAAVGRPDAVRAVGAAIGRNPISILVPCHRAIGADGSLTGYAGGLERKRALLRLEGVAVAE